MRRSAALLPFLAVAPAFAANFGAPPAAATAPTVSAVSAPAAPVVAGPQATGVFRIVKADGSTLIQQGSLGANVLAGSVLNVSEADALVKANGRCAFNVKYDEVSAVAAAGTVNRLYSNDALIAQNSAIDLQPGAVKTVWTQPYLYAGLNNVRVVINAAGAAPSTGWLRVNVAGNCGGAAQAAAPATAPAPAPTPTPAPAPAVFKPGSGQWNTLYNAWGYSNYAVTQLKGKGYGRYAELAALNAAITAAVRAGAVAQTTYDSLIGTWNGFVTEAAFKAAIAAIVPGTPGAK
jgi:hypothetical protein